MPTALDSYCSSFFVIFPAKNSAFFNLDRISSFFKAFSFSISSFFLFYYSSFFYFASNLLFALLSSVLLIESSGAYLAKVVKYEEFLSSYLKLYLASYSSISDSLSRSSLSTSLFY